MVYCKKSEWRTYMIKTKKREATRKLLHNTFVELPRLRGGCVISSGYIKTGIFYESVYAKTKELKGLMREELGDRGFMQLVYGKDRALVLSIGFSWGKNDEEYELIKQIFFDDHEDAFDGYSDDELPYHDLKLVNVIDVNMTRIEYRLNDLEYEDIAKRLDRLLDYVVNAFDIYTDIREGNI